MEKHSFKLEVVLSAIYGVLLCHISDVYRVLNFITNDNIYTHQLARVGKEIKPVIEKQYPFLKEIDLSGINPSNWKLKLQEIKSKFPNDLELFPIEFYTNRDPFKNVNLFFKK